MELGLLGLKPDLQSSRWVELTGCAGKKVGTSTGTRASWYVLMATFELWPFWLNFGFFEGEISIRRARCRVLCPRGWPRGLDIVVNDYEGCECGVPLVSRLQGGGSKKNKNQSTEQEPLLLALKEVAKIFAPQDGSASKSSPQATGQRC